MLLDKWTNTLTNVQSVTSYCVTFILLLFVICSTYEDFFIYLLCISYCALTIPKTSPPKNNDVFPLEQIYLALNHYTIFALMTAVNVYFCLFKFIYACKMNYNMHIYIYLYVDHNTYLDLNRKVKNREINVVG